MRTERIIPDRLDYRLATIKKSVEKILHEQNIKIGSKEFNAYLEPEIIRAHDGALCGLTNPIAESGELVTYLSPSTPDGPIEKRAINKIILAHFKTISAVRMAILLMELDVPFALEYYIADNTNPLIIDDEPWFIELRSGREAVAAQKLEFLYETLNLPRILGALTTVRQFNAGKGGVVATIEDALEIAKAILQDGDDRWFWDTKARNGQLRVTALRKKVAKELGVSPKTVENLLTEEVLKKFDRS